MRLPLDFAELLSYPSILSVCIRTECKWRNNGSPEKVCGLSIQSC